ncbi:hypothetical protein [Fictibacillus phosphorivorans]|uniref:hypothetical protein n=1 Tax=Fictibacillus phosphorivorans TaxID=1221500 RepID=UPI0035ED4702
MELVGQLQDVGFRADNRISPYITAYSTVEISHRDLELFLHATHLVASHPNFETCRKKRLNCVFSNTHQFTFSMDDHEVGTQAAFAFYDYVKLQAYNEVNKVIVFVEEMVHFFWDIEDEIETKRIVCEIIPEAKYDYERDRYVV